MRLSYIEIYNEMIYDLLSTCHQRMGEQILTVHEDKNKDFFVKGANEI
jgi:hypothetical protein